MVDTNLSVLVRTFVIAASAMLAPQAAAQGRSVEFAHRWVAGETARYRVAEEMIQEVSGEVSTTLVWNRVLEYSERVLESDPETGLATVERSIETVVVEVEGDGVEAARFDSEDPRTDGARSNPLIAPFARLAGSVVTFTVDSTGRVTEASGADGLWENALSGFTGTALSGALAGATPQEDALRRQIEGGLSMFPGRPVRVRESWTQQTPHATPVGTLTSDLKHRFEGFTRAGAARPARITTTGTLRLGDGEGPGTALTRLAGITIELGETDLRGTTLFDHEAGRILRQEMTVETSWRTSVEGLEEIGGEGNQRMVQRSVLERLD